MSKRLRKPSIKMVWVGNKGNKFRQWQVTNIEGGKSTFNENKDRAHEVYKANVRMYNKLKKRR